MYAGKKVIVVIPCYNVERHIREVISSMPDYVDEIIAVDDAATDGTWEELKRTTDARLTVLRHRRNRGLGGAMKTGMKKALEKDADIMVKVDGDGQMDASRMTSLLDPIKEGRCDYAKGNRLYSAADRRGMPLPRLFGNLGFSFLTKAATGYWRLMDPQNGYIAVSRNILSRINLRRIAKNYFFENSMLIEASINNARIAEVQMPSIYGDEVSGIKVEKIVFQFPWQLLKGFARRIVIKNILRDLSPFVIFLFLGLALMIPGGAFGLYLWLKAVLTQSTVPAPTGTIMLSLVPLICGYILVVQAITIDIILSPDILHLNSEKKEDL